MDIKLGLYMAAFAGIGVQVGIKIQNIILAMWGPAGSDLYVSLSFVAVLVVVGGIVMVDAVKSAKSCEAEQTCSIALRLQKIEMWPMITFKKANLRISMWFSAACGLRHRHAGGHPSPLAASWACRA